ncbi:MAG: hypothetical protein RSE62_03505 [Citrobacter sp.]
MITKAQAMTVRGTLYHRIAKNTDGSALRARVNGACKTWVKNPTAFKLPMKYGLKSCFYITEENAHDWLMEEPK